MSKDYKRPNKKPGRARDGTGSLVIGILIGLLLGLGVALAAAWYINKMPTPFLNRTGPPASSEPSKSAVPEAAESGDRSGKPSDRKPRFDFYKILPGTEEAVTERQFSEAQQKPSTAQAREAFFLQAGAFQSAPDADNMKARLALLGVEASVQTTSLPDKGVWHRVRAGPYVAIEDLNRTREILKQNGIDTTLIRVREERSQAAK